MSTLNYYSSRSRASARQEKVRNEMTKSSLFLADNGLDSIYGKPSYDSLKKGTSYMDTGGRTGRARTRDHSADFYVKPRQDEMFVGCLQHSCLCWRNVSNVPSNLL